jgi:hypothetical protein
MQILEVTVMLAIFEHSILPFSQIEIFVHKLRPFAYMRLLKPLADKEGDRKWSSSVNISIDSMFGKAVAINNFI